MITESLDWNALVGVARLMAVVTGIGAIVAIALKGRYLNGFSLLTACVLAALIASVSAQALAFSQTVVGTWLGGRFLTSLSIILLQLVLLRIIRKVEVEKTENK